MGSGQESSGFLGSKWMTIILVVILVILAAIFIWALRSGWFYKVGRKKATTPNDDFQPGGAMNQQFYKTDEYVELRDINPKLRLAAQLSWEKPVVS
ncbi:hypothetical protein GF312_13850 [Candidatus Poribacteria bacterium]|nr:hypothetical protein [Candidatus Poribacteria bacterium]